MCCVSVCVFACVCVGACVRVRNCVLACATLHPITLPPHLLPPPAQFDEITYPSPHCFRYN